MKAGFFEKDVTPPVGIYLAGYTSKRPSQDVDDPLFLRIVAIEDDRGERIVLVTADLLKFPRDMAWRTKIWCERQFGLKSASVVINLSHTHSAPGLFIQRCYPHWPVDSDYICRFEQAIREGIEIALKNLHPIRLCYGLHQAHFGISRRLPQPELGGKVRMASNPNGYYDPDLPVFAFYSDEGRLEAIFYSYGCHPTSKSTLKISADWACNLPDQHLLPVGRTVDGFEYVLRPSGVRVIDLRRDWKKVLMNTLEQARVHVAETGPTGQFTHDWLIQEVEKGLPDQERWATAWKALTAHDGIAHDAILTDGQLIKRTGASSTKSFESDKNHQRYNGLPGLYRFVIRDETETKE